MDLTEKKDAAMTIDTEPICVFEYLVNTKIPATVVMQKRQPGSISMSRVKNIQEEDDIYSLFAYLLNNCKCLFIGIGIFIYILFMYSYFFLPTPGNTPESLTPAYVYSLGAIVCILMFCIYSHLGKIEQRRTPMVNTVDGSVKSEEVSEKTFSNIEKAALKVQIL